MEYTGTYRGRIERTSGDQWPWLRNWMCDSHIVLLLYEDHDYLQCFVSMKCMHLGIYKDFYQQSGYFYRRVQTELIFNTENEQKARNNEIP